MTTLKLDQYINFDYLDELNHHVSLHVKNNSLTDTQYKLLTILSQHSVKYLGASYLKLDTLASLLEVSKSTVQRSLRALVGLSVITKKHTFRPISGGYGATIFVIEQYVDTSHDHSNMTTCNESKITAGSRLLDRLEQKETTSSKSKYNNSLVTNQSSINREYNLNYKDVVPSHIPSKLGNHLIRFFDSATLTRLYDAMKNALKVYEHRDEYTNNHIEDWMYRATNALITALKNHRYNPQKYQKVNNIFGYAHQTCLNIAVKDEFNMSLIH